MSDTQKTLEQWLNELEEPHKSKALKNCYLHGKANDFSRTLDAALVAAFIWNKTPEGFRYWFDLFWEIRKVAK